MPSVSLSYPSGDFPALTPTEAIDGTVSVNSTGTVGPSANVDIPASFTIAGLKLLLVTAVGGDLTVTTNPGGTGDSFTVKDGSIGVLWTHDMGTANPLANDVTTGVRFHNAGAGTVTYNIRVWE